MIKCLHYTSSGSETWDPINNFKINFNLYSLGTEPSLTFHRKNVDQIQSEIPRG